jgi:hypothetical protein
MRLSVVVSRKRTLRKQHSRKARSWLLFPDCCRGKSDGEFRLAQREVGLVMQLFSKLAAAETCLFQRHSARAGSNCMHWKLPRGIHPFRPCNAPSGFRELKSRRVQWGAKCAGQMTAMEAPPARPNKYPAGVATLGTWTTCRLVQRPSQPSHRQPSIRRLHSWARSSSYLASLLRRGISSTDIPSVDALKGPVTLARRRNSFEISGHAGRGLISRRFPP